MDRRSATAFLAAALALALALAGCATAPAGTSSPSIGAGPTSAPASPTAHPTVSATTDPATPSAAATAEATASEAPSDPLLTVELSDVRTGETFTLGELAADEGQVLLEPMAIWCTSCRAQQREIVRAHQAGSFTSVSLDVELSEVPEDLAAYAEREGFDWRFALADAALYRLLQERFTPAATNPPSTPLIVIEADGTVRPLEFGVGVRSAEQLLAELGGG